MPTLRTGASVLLIGFLVQAATLERLTLDDMVRKSTSIARARVTGSYTERHGAVIYTHYTVQILERWKGSSALPSNVVVAGGVAGGLRQTFSGSPKLSAGREYILFLWQAPRSGLTHIIGLTQGLFDLKRDQKGELVATRAASSEAILDGHTGRPLKDEPVSMRLADLRLHVSRTLAQGGTR